MNKNEIKEYINSYVLSEEFYYILMQQAKALLHDDDYIKATEKVSELEEELSKLGSRLDMFKGAAQKEIVKINTISNNCRKDIEKVSSTCARKQSTLDESCKHIKAALKEITTANTKTKKEVLKALSEVKNQVARAEKIAKFTELFNVDIEKMNNLKLFVDEMAVIKDKIVKTFTT